MTRDKRLFSYVIRFSARRADEARLQAVLERNFGARDVNVDVQAAPTPVPAKRPRPPRPEWRPNPGTLAAGVYEALTNGPMRLVDIGRVIGRTNIGSLLRGLVEIAAVKKLDRGLYARADYTGTAPIPQRRLGPALQRIYDLLKEPKSAVELKSLLRVSRQAVDQHLKRLIKRGLVARRPIIGESGAYVYVRSEDRRSAVLHQRMPVLREAAAHLLSMIPSDGSVRLRDLIGVGPEAIGPRKTIERLRALGLLQMVGTPHRRVVELTDRGRVHPQYDLTTSKAPSLRDTLNPDGPMMTILLALHALNRARSHELTLITGIGRGRRPGSVGTGNYVQRLEDVGFIGMVDPDADGHPEYQLTKEGLAFVATLRGEIPFPDPVEARERLDRERAAEREAQRERGRRFNPPGREPGALRGRLADIIAVLKSRGPLKTRAINPLLPMPYVDPRAIHLAMKTLASLGHVVRVGHEPGRQITWDVPRQSETEGGVAVGSGSPTKDDGAVSERRGEAGDH